MPPIPKKVIEEILAPALQTIGTRVSKLEEAMTIHLTESGEIRNDVAWIKRMFNVVVGIGSMVMASVIYLLFKMILKVQG